MNIIIHGIIVTMLLFVGSASANDLYPFAPPGSTMHTLDEIYHLGTAVYHKIEAIASPSTLSPTSKIMSAGFYNATNLTEVDADLVEWNISSNVSIFGIKGIMSVGVLSNKYPSRVIGTGQTNSYGLGDDGELKIGATFNPRFTVMENTNCVLDNVTGLIWARNANLLGAANWYQALSNCNTLVYGGTNAWRLPNIKELLSLLNYGFTNPALCNASGTKRWEHNDPFVNVQSGNYWSSTTGRNNTNYAWFVYVWGGSSTILSKSTDYSIWPVRNNN